MSGAMAVSSVCLSVTLIHCVRMHIKCGSVYLLVYFHQMIRFTSGKDQNVVQWSLYLHSSYCILEVEKSRTQRSKDAKMQKLLFGCNSAVYVRCCYSPKVIHGPCTKHIEVSDIS